MRAINDCEDFGEVTEPVAKQILAESTVSVVPEKEGEQTVSVTVKDYVHKHSNIYSCKGGSFFDKLNYGHVCPTNQPPIGQVLIQHFELRYYAIETGYRYRVALGDMSLR